MRFEDVLDWLRSSPMNQAIVAVAVILLLLLVLLIVRSRRSSARQKAASSARLSGTGGKTHETLELYRDSHPAFYRIVREYGERQPLDELMTDPEFAGAFEKLKVLKARTERQAKDKRVAALQISALGDREQVNRETRAAMLTILRVLYLNREPGGSLTPQADAELDRLLESLTD